MSIKDYNGTTCLDPQLALAYNKRGNAYKVDSDVPYISMVLELDMK